MMLFIVSHHFVSSNSSVKHSFYLQFSKSIKCSLFIKCPLVKTTQNSNISSVCVWIFKTRKKCDTSLCWSFSIVEISTYANLSRALFSESFPTHFSHVARLKFWLDLDIRRIILLSWRGDRYCVQLFNFAYYYGP